MDKTLTHISLTTLKYITNNNKKVIQKEKKKFSSLGKFSFLYGAAII